MAWSFQFIAGEFTPYRPRSKNSACWKLNAWWVNALNASPIKVSGDAQTERWRADQDTAAERNGMSVQGSAVPEIIVPQLFFWWYSTLMLWFDFEINFCRQFFTIMEINGKRLGFDRLLVKRFVRLFPILFPRWSSRTSLLFFLLLVFGILGKLSRFFLCIFRGTRSCSFVMAGEFIAYQVGVVPSRFYADLGKKDKPAFYSTFLEASLYILATAIVSFDLLMVRIVD